jgi:hypothetical protein
VAAELGELRLTRLAANAQLARHASAIDRQDHAFRAVDAALRHHLEPAGRPTDARDGLARAPPRFSHPLRQGSASVGHYPAPESVSTTTSHSGRRAPRTIC